MKYYMPTIVIEEDNVVEKNADIFKKLGQKAIIVTGRNSSKKNGSLNDVIRVLTKNNIDYVVFDEVIENPPIIQCVLGAKLGKDCDFVIGIGGGSPLDVAKGVALLIKNGPDNYMHKLFGRTGDESLPVVAIPTTCGTGSETTPYSVFTDENIKNKVSMKQRIFPKYALLDIKYFKSMPLKVRISTVIDALTHAIESYVNRTSTPYSSMYAFKTIVLFGKNKEHLLEEDLDDRVLRDYVRASTFAGCAISQTGTSLPHTLGYPLTFYYDVPHGIANSIFTKEFLGISEKKYVDTILRLARFNSLDELGDYLINANKMVCEQLIISDLEIEAYSMTLMENQAKLKKHPGKVTIDDVRKLYEESLKNYE